jgi:hypothetical protein
MFLIVRVRACVEDTMVASSHCYQRWRQNIHYGMLNYLQNHASISSSYIAVRGWFPICWFSYVARHPNVTLCYSKTW